MISYTKDNELLLDFGQNYGYDCRVIIDSWNKGMKWYNFVDGEVEAPINITEPGLSVKQIAHWAKESDWLQEIPTKVLRQLIDYEAKYKGAVFMLLTHISRDRFALELFQLDPKLVWFFLKVAQQKQWSFEMVGSLFHLKRPLILGKCGLPNTKSFYRIFQSIEIEVFSDGGFNNLYDFYLWCDPIKLRYFPIKSRSLMRYVFRYPYMAGSPILINHYKLELKKIEEVVNDIVRMVERLEKPVPKRQMFECQSLQQLEKLHDQLVDEINTAKIKQNLAPYPIPKIKGTKNIVLIKNLNGLAKEGRQMRHCIQGYHRLILRKKYCVFKILEPERATLGIKIDSKHKYAIDQIKGECNVDVSDELRLMVKRWMEGS